MLSVSVFFNRLNNQKHDMQWLDDSARDVMIAEKISKQREFFFVQPNSGALSFIKNSFFYYNFLGVLYLFSGGIDAFLVLYAIIQSFSVFAGFLIGYLIGGPWLGLICLAILSFDAELIFMQQSVYQRNWPATLSLIIVFLSMYFFRKPTKIKIALLYLFYLFSILIHSSMLTFIPVLFILSIYYIYSTSSAKRIANYLYIISLTIISAVTWIFLSGNELSAIVSGFSELKAENYQFFRVEDLFSNIFDLLYQINSKILMQYLLIPFIILFFVILVLFVSKKLSKELNVYCLYLYSILLHYLFSSLVSAGRITEEQYLSNYLVLMLIFIPIALFSLYSLFKNYSLRVLFVFFAFVYISLTFSFRKEKISFQEYYIFNSLSDMIYADIQKDGGIENNDFLIIDYSDWASIGWFSPSLIFFLEDDLKGSLTFLSNVENNLEYNYPEKINKIYLLCHHLPEKTKFMQLSNPNLPGGYGYILSPSNPKESFWETCVKEFQTDSKENEAISSFFKKDYKLEEYYFTKDFHKKKWGLFKLSVIQ